MDYVSEPIMTLGMKGCVPRWSLRNPAKKRKEEKSFWVTTKSLGETLCLIGFGLHVSLQSTCAGDFVVCLRRDDIEIPEGPIDILITLYQWKMTNTMGKPCSGVVAYLDEIVFHN